MASQLRVVVADDHHHVLPAIHLAIRQRRLPFASLHVLHVDAHPDLSFPRSADPQALVFAPEELYDALDESVSGIAEFLLPLVYAGHVRRVSWVKPHWAQQMPIQANKRVFVGKNKHTNALSVSLPLAHFIDEDAYAPVDDLDPSTTKEWELLVAELPECGSESPSPDEVSSTSDPSSPRSANDAVLRDIAAELHGGECKGYLLDIDLDFFSTWNPFRKDLEQRAGASVAAIVARVFCSLQFKNMQNPMPVSTRVSERRAFTAAMEQIQSKELFLDPDGAECRALVETVLLPLYGLEHIGASERLLLSFFETLSSLDEEARRLVWWAGPNMDLPHHLSSDNEIEYMVETFAEFLVSNGCRANPPRLVTIAKSTGDEYLPPHQLEFVQSRVLRMLTDLFGPLEVEFVEYEDVSESVGDNEWRDAC